MDYDTALKDKFKNLEINLVKHDTSPTGLPCYIEAHVGSVSKKDKGSLVRDLGNYIYRLGLRYQMTPEFRGKGKKQTLRWFMSWEDIEPYRISIQEKFGFRARSEKYLPGKFRSLIIQNSKRGVYAQ